MKNTRQRTIILKIINNGNEHLNAFEIYEKAKEVVSNISLGTVYRNLKYLVDNKKITTIYDGSEKLRYDKNIEHQHFICIKCHQIIDIYDLNFKKVDNYQNNIVMNYKIVLEGICEKCQKEE